MTDQTNKPKMSKAEAGRLGGKTTAQRHGSEHFAKIGRRGGSTTWQRYSLKPVGTSGYAMVRRSDNKVVAITGMRPRRKTE